MASAGTAPTMATPSRDWHRYSSPAHSALTGIPRSIADATSARNAVFADSSAACTSGNPPPKYRPAQPSGKVWSRSGSMSTTSTPQAASSSMFSV